MSSGENVVLFVALLVAQRGCLWLLNPAHYNYESQLGVMMIYCTWYSYVDQRMPIFQSFQNLQLALKLLLDNFCGEDLRLTFIYTLETV